MNTREQGTGNREQGTGNREQGTGNREQGTGNREQGTGNRETGNRERPLSASCLRGIGTSMCGRKRETGNGKRETGNGKRGTKNEERRNRGTKRARCCRPTVPRYLSVNRAAPRPHCHRRGSLSPHRDGPAERARRTGDTTRFWGSRRPATVDDAFPIQLRSLPSEGCVFRRRGKSCRRYERARAVHPQQLQAKRAARRCHR